MENNYPGFDKVKSILVSIFCTSSFPIKKKKQQTKQSLSFNFIIYSVKHLWTAQYQ